MDAPGSEDPVLTASDDRRARDHFRVDPPPRTIDRQFQWSWKLRAGFVEDERPCGENGGRDTPGEGRGFKAVLPFADVYVYDNNSTDRTVARAAEAGAIVRTERRQGKGQTVRRMFADIHADIYLLVDGDDTYDATVATRIVAQIVDGDRHELVLEHGGDRQRPAAYRRGCVPATSCCRVWCVRSLAARARTCYPATRACRAAS